jgi:hypothetical protein
MPGVMVRLPPSTLSRLDAWIAGLSDAPSRPEAIRRLIEAGLSSSMDNSPGSKS